MAIIAEIITGILFGIAGAGLLAMIVLFNMVDKIAKTGEYKTKRWTYTRVRNEENK